MVTKLIHDAARLLTNSDTPLLDARVLMAEAANTENAALLFGDITPEQEQLFEKFIQMRRSGMPVAYILGKKEFMGFTFKVNENTLIPRPDTECLVERVLEKHFTAPKILDLCTGSGCIGISLALMIENSTALLADLSDGALQIAEENIHLHHLENRVSTLKTDVLTDDLNGFYDIIVSNPPYIPTSTVPTLDVSFSEPKMALDGGSDGLDFYRIIIINAASHLNEGGMLALEIGYDQGEAVTALCREYFEEVNLFKDYGGNDRVVTATHRFR